MLRNRPHRRPEDKFCAATHLADLAIWCRNRAKPGGNSPNINVTMHHVAGWAESLGNANINNLILLCRRHHTLIHNTKWTINRTPDGDHEFTHLARAT